MTENPANLMAQYWDDLSEVYQSETVISTRNFHFGPLLPGDDQLKIIPPLEKDMKALELGGGAGQNSLVLARRGLKCTLTDISQNQLDHGQKLAKVEGLSIVSQRLDMDALNTPNDWEFDFIHSTYALPFVSDPATIIQKAHDLLKPGGHFLLTVGHPLYTGEWLELDEDEGCFITSYFDPQPDTREMESEGTIKANVWPLSTVHGWLRKAGFQIERFEEPRPNPIETLGTEGPDSIPYLSESWMELYPVLREIPIVAVFLARKPA